LKKAAPPGIFPWLEWEAIAYGALGLRPWEFWKLTPRQFVKMVYGQAEHLQRIVIVQAWWTSSLVMAGFSKKGLPPLARFLDVLSGELLEEHIKADAAQKKKDYEEIVKRLGDGTTSKAQDEAAMKAYIKREKEKHAG